MRPYNRSRCHLARALPNLLFTGARRGARLLCNRLRPSACGTICVGQAMSAPFVTTPAPSSALPRRARRARDAATSKAYFTDGELEDLELLAGRAKIDWSGIEHVEIDWLARVRPVPRRRRSGTRARSS